MRRVMSLLADHDLVCFEDRVIRAPCPPITRTQIEEIAAHCPQGIPKGLLELWRTAFGGALDYSLRVDFAGHVDYVDISELFHPDSDGYHDIWGWIDDTKMHRPGELSAANVDFDAPLTYLPIAGRDWQSRIFVDVSGGPKHGHVFAYREGTPPAGGLRLAETAFAEVAPDVRGLFQRMRFESDPLLSSHERPDFGGELRDSVDRLAIGGLDEQIAAEFVASLIRRAHLDWRAALDANSIAGQTELEVLALESVAHDDDLELLERVIRAGVTWTRRLRANATLLDHALFHSSWKVVEYCLAGQEFALEASISHAAADLPWEIADHLLARGARADGWAAYQAAAAGNTETARTIAIALALENPQAAHQLREDTLEHHRELAIRHHEDDASPEQRKQWRREAERFRYLSECLWLPTERSRHTNAPTGYAEDAGGPGPG